MNCAGARRGTELGTRVRAGSSAAREHLSGKPPSVPSTKRLGSKLEKATAVAPTSVSPRGGCGEKNSRAEQRESAHGVPEEPRHVRGRCGPLAPACLPPGSLAQGSHSLGLPRGPISRAAASPLRTFFSLVLLGSCCTARAKPALSCSRPAPTASQSSTFPSAATLSTWKRWPCWGPGSQTTWTTSVRGRAEKGRLPHLPARPGVPPLPPPLLFQGDLRGEAWEPPHPPEGSKVPPVPAENQDSGDCGSDGRGGCDSWPGSSENARGSCSLPAPW